MIEIDCEKLKQTKGKKMRMNLTIHDKTMDFWIDANKLYVVKLLQEVCNTLHHKHGMEFDLIEVVLGEENDEDEGDDEEVEESDKKESDKPESVKDLTFTLTEFCDALLLVIQKSKEGSHG